MKSLYIVLLLCAASVCNADVLSYHESNEDTPIDMFVMEHAQHMQRLTDELGVEVCGMITASGSKLGLVVSTSHSELFCESIHVISGHQPLNITVHTHPTPNSAGVLKLSRKTSQLVGQTHVRVKRRAFSTGDIAAGAGYLITEGVVLFQDGVSTRQVTVEP